MFHVPLFPERKNHCTSSKRKKKDICAIYEDGAIAEITVHKWFASFRSGNFGSEDQKRSGKTAVVDVGQIEMLIKNNPHYTWDIAEMLHIFHMSFVRQQLDKRITII